MKYRFAMLTIAYAELNSILSSNRDLNAELRREYRLIREWLGEHAHEGIVTEDPHVRCYSLKHLCVDYKIELANNKVCAIGFRKIGRDNSHSNR
jgi:hypothetical protein